LRVNDRPGEARNDELPVIGRFFPAPVAAKVPEVILLFWIVKILTTAGGEATSDYLKTYGNFKGGGIEVLVIVVGLLLAFGTRRYRAFAYWAFAFAIAITGTGVSDFLHLDVHIPYAGTTLLWAVILAGIFWVWQRNEGTLSIHSITTQRREGYYWATVFATFALGTALGDFTATSLNLGYLDSGILFTIIILIPALAHWRFGLNGIAAFWMSYVVTRPLGASFADYISKPKHLSGINFGDGPTAIVFAIAVFVLVSWLALARPDIQQPLAAPAERTHTPTPLPGSRHTGEPELEVE
ncbi:MAG: COG4705 family protein, partial [Solirubrobacteraceae bacterium]